MSEVNFAAAAKVFNKIDAHLRAKDWKYEKDAEKFEFTYQVSGDDLPMKFVMKVDPERELIRIFSFLSFDFAEDKRIEGAVAVSVANYGMVNGSFGYDITDGTVFHKISVAYTDIEINADMINYIMGVGMATVDKYNDRFLALNKGYITISDFINKE